MSDAERVAKHAVNTLSQNTDNFLDVWAILCGVGCEGRWGLYSWNNWANCEVSG